MDITNFENEIDKTTFDPYGAWTNHFNKRY